MIQTITDKNSYKKRRKTLSTQMENNSLLLVVAKDQIMKGDEEYFDFADPDLFYLTGIEQANTNLLLYKDAQGNTHEYLFIEKTDQHSQIWKGEKLSPKEARKTCGIKSIKWNKDFHPTLKEILQNISILYTLREEISLTTHSQFYNILNYIKSSYNLERKSLEETFKGLREIKNNCEINNIKNAIKITRQGFQDILSNIKNLSSEKEIEARFNYTFTKNFSSHSYHPVIASGEDACILHYIKNNKPLKKKSLVLIDAGAEYHNYKADITRTIPINGEFNSREREVYNACLNVQKYAINELSAGTEKIDWEKKVHTYMAKQLNKLGLLTMTDITNIEENWKDTKSFSKLKNYFPHATGHFLGLETHDIGNYKGALKEGQIITVEPGIYIKEEGIGIRIEDNILVTKSSCKNLSKNIPKDPETLEKIINEK